MEHIKNLKKEVKERVKITIPFTNSAIDRLKGMNPNKQYEKVGFKNLRGIWLYWNTNSGTKKFKLRYKFNGRDFDLTLGQYIPGEYGVDQVMTKINTLNLNYKEKGKWVRNPKDEVINTKEFLDSQKLTIREVIEKAVEANFPRKDIEGRIASITARQHSLFLLGHNHRIDKLKYADDEEGMCTISHTYPSWEKFWNENKSGKGLKTPEGEKSLYDSKLGSTIIDNLTPGQVERYLENRTRTYGYKKNILKALQYLWGYARNNLKCFGDIRPLDPTTMKEGGVQLKQPSKSNFKGSKYNDVSLTLEQFKIVNACTNKLKKERPYQMLAIKMLSSMDIRISECLKLKKEDIKKDHITVRKEIRKLRNKGVKVKSKKIPIDELTQAIIDEIKLTDKEHPQYRFIPWLFPSPMTNLSKLSDPDYARGENTRLKKIMGSVNTLKEMSGIDFALKTLRKTYITQSVEAEVQQGNSLKEAIKRVSESTHPGNPQTTEAHYYKPDFRTEIKRAKELSKVIKLKRDI